jgi:hypothetical protein
MLKCSLSARAIVGTGLASTGQYRDAIFIDQAIAIFVELSVTYLWFWQDLKATYLPFSVETFAISGLAIADILCSRIAGITWPPISRLAGQADIGVNTSTGVIGVSG